MTNTTQFIQHITKSYTFKKDYIVLGGAMLYGKCASGTTVKIPLKTINRHGLIAGATGTGKTKTIQVLAEQLSLKGVPVLMMDLKGDLSGLAMPGSSNDHIVWRHGEIGESYDPQGLPVELMSISKGDGVPIRATVSEFGPVLLSKILELNDVQSGIISILFKYADDARLPLIDLKDLKELLKYAIGEGKAKLSSEYGNVSANSVNTIIRKIVEIEQQGAEMFFGEPSFEVDDLLLQDKQGRGKISIIRLTDIQDRPKLFSTFMLSLLAEVYATFEERGDNDVPKLAIFFDEAHLMFDQASKALLQQIEAIVKLIRSKGVGLYFCTQTPTDIPEEILGQLGLKIQHALRAFTAKDRKAIKKTAENYPLSDFYKTDQLITKMGIGEAMVTALNEKGIPTALAHTLLRAPISRMDILTKKEIKDIVSQSDLMDKYAQEIDRDSAYEILKKKIEVAHKQENLETKQQQLQDGEKAVRRKKNDESFVSKASKNTMVRQIGRTLFRELARGLLGALGVKSTRRRRKSSWF